MLPESMIKKVNQKTLKNKQSAQQTKSVCDKTESPTKEYGGRKGKDPTRYGDWEKNGRCIDF
jgi:hypothetical protein